MTTQVSAFPPPAIRRGVRVIHHTGGDYRALTVLNVTHEGTVVAVSNAGAKPVKFPRTHALVVMDRKWTPPARPLPLDLDDDTIADDDIEDWLVRAAEWLGWVRFSLFPLNPTIFEPELEAARSQFNGLVQAYRRAIAGTERGSLVNVVA